MNKLIRVSNEDHKYYGMVIRPRKRIDLDTKNGDGWEGVVVKEPDNMSEKIGESMMIFDHFIDQYCELIDVVESVIVESDLIKAAKLIKKECNENWRMCSNCELSDSQRRCMLSGLSPLDWSDIDNE